MHKSIYKSGHLSAPLLGVSPVVGGRLGGRVPFPGYIGSPIGRAAVGESGGLSNDWSNGCYGFSAVLGHVSGPFLFSDIVDWYLSLYNHSLFGGLFLLFGLLWFTVEEQVYYYVPLGLTWDSSAQTQDL